MNKDDTTGQPADGQGYPPGLVPGAGGYPPYPGPTPPRGSDERLTVQAGRYWAGAAATALVAALIGVIGVVVFERVLDVALVPPPDVFGTGSHLATYAIAGAVLALVAAAVLYGLTLAAPRPRVFFGWIMALFTLTWAVLPFAWTSHALSAALSGVVNLVIGIAIWSLLAGVGARTTVPVPRA